VRQVLLNITNEGISLAAELWFESKIDDERFVLRL
jgi:hypothetical protein